MNTTPHPSRALEIDLASLAGAFGQRLHEAGLPVSPRHSEHYARSLQLVQPRSRHALYLVTRAVFLTDVHDADLFDVVFAEVFGTVGAASADDAEPAPALYAAGV